MRNIEKAKKALLDVSTKFILNGRRISFSKDEIIEVINDSTIWAYIVEDCDNHVYIRGYLNLNGWNDKVRLDISSRDSLTTVKSKIASMMHEFYHALGIEC